MNILLLSRIIPKEIEKEVRSKSQNTMQDAGISLQERMIDGFLKNGVTMQLINKMPIFSYPKSYSDAIVGEERFGEDEENINLGFVNVCYIKQLLGCFSFKKHIRKYVQKNQSPIILSYTLGKEFLRMIKYAKKLNPNVKSCAVVADLPEYIDLSSNISLARKIYSKITSWRIRKLYKYVDAYVFLTKQMAKKLQNDKPFVVVEGIATDSFKQPVNIEKQKEKTIFYAGTLHKKFGVLNLMDAFFKIKDDSYRLVICGTGDSEEIIKKQAEKDGRITFHSILPRQQVLKIMQQSTVIVNPRQNNEEFTKYSFPSKNLEALSSGVPFVAYKLDGIPDEYDDYIFYVKGNTAQNLADTLMKVCEMPETERNKLSKKAREFVLENKNAVVQTQKIIELINSL
ncbi:MAG: glycosyltransferase [Clostridia bacterium]|nr:glycosyltransferase [Clostridia bacterium]